MIYFGVHANTTRWLAVLLKDFEHHGMIGDFNDAKVLTVKGIEDFFLAERPDQKEPGPQPGPVKYVTDHAHVHVSALSGDVYGPGCGLGSGNVEMKFKLEDYPADIKDKRLPYLQFSTDFIAHEQKPPKIDGRIEKGEWEGAGRRVIHLGTSKGTVTEYG